MRKFITLSAVAALLAPLSLRGQLKAEAGEVCLRGHMSNVSVRIGRLNGTLDDGYPKIHGVGLWDRCVEYAW